MRSALISSSLLLVLCACNHSSEPKNDAVVVPKDSVKKTVAVDTPATRDCAVLYKKARHMDSIVLKALDVDPIVANKTIRAFTDFAYYCESDSLSPVFLIKTAQVAMALNNATQARVVLDRVINNYPRFKNKPAAMFMLAQLYDERTMLNNEEEAKKLYEKLIFEYPKSEWASAARSAIKLLGKTDEEIIEQFNKKQ
jgi:predicted Zn-dependent protease